MMHMQTTMSSYNGLRPTIDVGAHTAHRSRGGVALGKHRNKIAATPRASTQQEVSKFQKSLKKSRNTEERIKLLEDFHKTSPEIAWRSLETGEISMSQEGEQLISDMCAFYDIWGAKYAEDLTSGKVEYRNLKFVADRVAGIMRPDERGTSKVLDVGAGTGLLGIALNELGFEMMDAMDGSPGMLEQAKELNIYKNFFTEVLNADSVKPLGSGDYDVVVSSACFIADHIPAPALRAMVASVKKNGYLVISAVPHNDIDVGIREVIHTLKRENVIRVLASEYVPNAFRDVDGTVFVMMKL